LSGRGLCDELITRPEESYWLWRVVCDQESSYARRLKPATGLWKIQPQWVVTAGKQTKLSTSTCFEQVYCSPSGGTTLYIQQMVYVMRLCWLAVGKIGMEFHSDPAAASQHKRIIRTNCRIYRVVPPDDEQQSCSKQVEVNYW